MKTLLAIAAVALTGLALPQKAEAGHSSCNSSYTYQSGRTSCGCPIYTKRIFNGYDCYRRPIYRYISVPVVHRCRSNHYSSNRGCSSSSYNRHYNRGYSSSYYSYNRHYNRGYSRSYSRGCR